MSFASSACVVLALAGAAPELAAAADIYVDQRHPNCSDTGGNAGSPSRPYCRISAAAAVATGGTRVLVSEGSYNGPVETRSGTSTNRLIFEAEPGETVTVTGGQYGFYVSNRRWVTINGFNVTNTVSDGIHVSSGSNNVEVTGNTVSYAGTPAEGLTAKGISVSNATNNLVDGNVVHHNSSYGIYLVMSSGNTVTRNRTSFNARVYSRGAAGIRLHSSTNNTVARNISHDNEDSGIDVHAGSNDNLLVNNAAYNNGDHGIDVLDATGQRIVSNSVYNNLTAGINAEGGSTGTRIVNNISVDNGINSPRTVGNIRVDSSSTSASSLNRDLVHLRTSAIQIVWGSSQYVTLAAFTTATGHEAAGIEADPRWVAPSLGDLRLAAGSPAIDSADAGASGASATDLNGNPRVDDPATVNTGTGPRAYDDRGAYEYAVVEGPPSAALTVTPSSGQAPLEVTADASASTDPDTSPIATYTFDFGDGTVNGPQAGATATHVYATPGTYTVTVTVTDTAGRPATATVEARVLAPPNLPPNPMLTVTPGAGQAPLNVTADASGSTDADSSPIADYRFDFGDGTIVGPQAGATATHTYTTAGTYTVRVTVTDTGGLSSAATAQVVVDAVDAPPSAALALTPGSGTAPLHVVADASGSRAGGAPIAEYRFDFGDGTVQGPQAGATATHTYTERGTFTVTLTVTDTAGRASTATTQITVVEPDLPPSAVLVLDQTSGPAPLAVTADASDSTDSDPTPIASYRFDFGDGTVVGPQTAATARHTYTRGGAFTVTVTVTDTGGRSSTATAGVLVFAEYIDNAGFETGLAGWNISGSGAGIALTRVAGGHSGGWAARASNSGTSPSSCVLNDAPNAVSVTAADGTYTATLWVRAGTPGATLRLRVREYSGGTLAGFAETNAVLTTSWQQVSLSYTPAAPGASSLDLNATVVNAAPGTCFDADDASLVLGPEDAGPPPDPNLAVNPGFESNLGGWNLSGSGAAVTLARVPGGRLDAWAAQLINTGAETATCTLNDSPNVVTTTSAGTYTASVWVRGEQAGATLKLRFREYSGSTLMGSATSEALLTTAWQKVTVAYSPAAPGASTLDLNAYVTGAPSGTCFHADDISIFLGAEVAPTP